MSQLDLQAQWMTIMFMLVSGLLLGIAYDSYRVVALQLRFPRWTLPCLDIMYWGIATWFVFQMLVKGNEGELRFYVILGLAFGAWLYYMLLSKLTVTITGWLIKAVQAIVRFLLRTGYVLIILPIKTLLLFLWSIMRVIIKSAMFLIRFVLRLAQPLWRLVRWIFSPLIMPWWNRWRMTEKMLRIRDAVQYLLRSVSKGWKRFKGAYDHTCLKVKGWFKRPPNGT